MCARQQSERLSGRDDSVLTPGPLAADVQGGAPELVSSLSMDGLPSEPSAAGEAMLPLLADAYVDPSCPSGWMPSLEAFKALQGAQGRRTASA